MQTAIYLRVSHKRSLEGYSLEVQEERCRAFAAAKGWTVAEVYRDEAISGRKMANRPGLQLLLAELKPRGIRAVIVFELDRAFRNLREQLNVYHDLQRAGVLLTSVLDNIDASTPEGMLLFSMKGSLSEFYSNQIGRKIKASLQHKASAGHWTGMPPLGYKRTKEGPLALADDPREAAATVEAFRLYALGDAGYGEVADALNRDGYMARDNHGRPVPFSRASVQRILQCRAYLGEVRHNGQWIPAGHPPLVSYEVFARCDEIRQERHAKHGRVALGRNRYPALLAGVAHCALCGGHLYHDVAGRAPDGGPRQRYYACYNRANRRTCTAPSAIMHEIDAVIWSLLEEIALPEHLAAEVLAELETLAKAEGEPPKIDPAAIHEKLRRLGRAYTSGAYTDAEYEAERAILLAQLRETTRPAEALDLSSAAKWLSDLPGLLRGAEPHQQQAAIRQLFSAVWVQDKRCVAVTPTGLYLPLVVAAKEHSTVWLPSQLPQLWNLDRTPLEVQP